MYSLHYFMNQKRDTNGSSRYLDIIDFCCPNALVLTDPHILCSVSTKTLGIMFLGWQRESEAGLSALIIR